ncbi:MAG TPA: hypothetical protein VEP89_06450 [Draconibacterium sp.]|nr:hypothetical protein [Draconibacterium sp.]
MKKVTFLLVGILIFGVSNLVQAQENSHGLRIDIPTHAMVALAGAEDIVFETIEPTLAGGKVTFEQQGNTEIWLNYSSIVSASNKMNDISAQLSSDIEGITIRVEVGEDAEDSKKGKTGTGTMQTLSSGSGATVVTGIGSCFTGTGVEKGHSVKYFVSADENSYADITANDNDITVTYTITER